MSTVREKIITALTLFWDKAQSLLIRKANIVDNCVSTSTEYPLSANQGTQLQSQIDELNSNLITTYTHITGDGNGYFYMLKPENGFILYSVIATKQTDIVVESICVAGDYYTIRCNSSLALGKVYEFALLYIKIGINA